MVRRLAVERRHSFDGKSRVVKGHTEVTRGKQAKAAV